MAEDDEARHGRDLHAYDVGRLLALSDGVFAIAMTLLVLTIPVPQLGSKVTDAALLSALNDSLPKLGSFALSFVLVGVYWVGHRRVLRGVVRTDGVVVWVNLLMLLLVCFVPFSEALLNRYGNLATAVVVYAANLAVLGAAAIALRVLSWPGLRSPASRGERLVAVTGSLLPTLVFAVSIPIALWNPQAAEWSWLSLFLVAGLWRRLVRPSIRRHSARPAAR